MSPLRAAVAALLALALAARADGAVVNRGAERQRSSDGLWTVVSAADVMLSVAELDMLSRPGGIAVDPSGPVYSLDVERLDALLRGAPTEPLRSASRRGVSVSLPLPGGTFARFAVVETPVVSPQLAVLVPESRTYAGVAVDRPDTRASIERTASGWSAMIRSPSATSFVTPLLRTQKDLYATASRSPEGGARFLCRVASTAGAALSGRGRRSPTAFGGRARVYRLAMAATGEYTSYFRLPGDDDDAAKRRAFDEIQKLVARLNEIYSEELAVQFVLVDREMDIIYTDGGADPYANDNSERLLEENQRNLDATLGNGAYDIGHVVGTDGGGLATPSSVCVGPWKARGQSGLADPVSDSFYVDYVAHEIGHQFGANHTYNGTLEDCDFRNAATAYEPGSGSTIMGYAGICGDQDVEGHASPYFHAASLDEMAAHLVGGGSCIAATDNGNHPPSITAGGNAVLVPMDTPFELTVAANDVDGDPLSYSFEQFDSGGQSPPDDDSDGVLRPLFRSRWSEQPRRPLPAIDNLVASTPATVSFEALPTRSAALSFRAVVRDRRGGFAAADIGVTVVLVAGPFRITAPIAGAVWKAGRPQTVRWRVANTTAAPLSCKAVRISISLDGGAKFTPLVASTRNDGAADVVAPAGGSPRSAIARVDCIGRPFFALSPAISIVP